MCSAMLGVQKKTKKICVGLDRRPANCNFVFGSFYISSLSPASTLLKSEKEFDDA
jgi:hypothetical protein